MTSNTRSRASRAAMIGSALECYDMSLYWFMAPLLASIFFPTFDKINALILIYIMPFVGIVVRPIGALFIGRMGDKHGRKKGLIVSIGGMAVATCAIGFLPTYEQAGLTASILFLTLRALQTFFIGGEFNGAAIFILEHNPNSKKGYFSGLYCMYTVMGILAAVAVCTLVAESPLKYWRAPYLIGFITGLVGLYMRYGVDESPVFLEHRHLSEVPLVDLAKKYKLIVAAIAVSTFFSALYCIPFILIISLIPEITSFSLSTIMKINTASTVLYMIAFPLFGYWSDKFSIAKTMISAAIAIIILTYPLMSLLSYNNLNYIIFMKLSFAVLTSWFVAPFHAWIQDMFHPRERYAAVSFSYAIGSQLGALMVPLGLWTWKATHAFLPTE